MFGIGLPYGDYHSELDFDHRFGINIERAIAVAQSQEKVIALRTARMMSTFEPKDRPTVAGCFDLPCFKHSQREWRPDIDPLHEAAAPPPPRQRKREDSQDRSYQASKNLRYSKLTARRRRRRHDRHDHRKPNYTELSSWSFRLRR